MEKTNIIFKIIKKSLKNINIKLYYHNDELVIA